MMRFPDKQALLDRYSGGSEEGSLRADGEVFTVEVLLNVVRREPTPMIHVFWRDIAERKRRGRRLLDRHF